ncbi:MAG TPA: tail fiber domain-containing protein [Steroidobacteraceae bacterium]|nr:tail fiber domain-containing protein [Steroidobacteraceae bacterium]
MRRATKETNMREIQCSILRPAILTCMSVAGLAVNSTANAECTDTNTCLGVGALQSNTTGIHNSAFGHEALADNTDGDNNTATGSAALRSNSAGRENTASGSFALFLNTTGSFNSAFGVQALNSNTSGHSNTAFGVAALGSHVSGQQNVAVGRLALFFNESGVGSTAVGAQAAVNSTGDRNTALGSSALAGVTTGQLNTATGSEAMRRFNGNENTANGYEALSGLGGGNQNTAIGAYALHGFIFNQSEDEHRNSGSFNTATGAHALERVDTGSSNTATGVNALARNTDGFYNTANGTGALKNGTTGYRNVALGYQAGFLITTGSDNIVIGAGNRGNATENGVIRIGVAANQKKAYMAGIRGVKTGLAAATAVFIDANGQLGTIKSSREAKENIRPIGAVSERLLALRPVTFQYKESDDDGGKPVQFGLVAEEVADTFPELVVYDGNGKPETVSYHLLSTLLLNEFQEERRITQAQALRIEQQSAELAHLKRQFAEMADTIERLKDARMVAVTK